MEDDEVWAWMIAMAPSKANASSRIGESQTKTRENASLWRTPMGHKMGSTNIEKQPLVDNRIVSYNIKGNEDGMKKGVSNGKEGEIGKGLVDIEVEETDVSFNDSASQLSSEVSGVSKGIRDGRSITIADVRKKVTGEDNQKARGNLVSEAQSPYMNATVVNVEVRELSKGMSMDGLEGNDDRVEGNQCVKAFLALKRVLRRLSPNLVFLSETKLHRREADMFRCMLGYEWVLQVDSEGKSEGLLLLWKEWDVRVQSFPIGHIDTTVKMDLRVGWRFSGEKAYVISRRDWIDFLANEEWMYLFSCVKSQEKFGSLEKLISSKREDLEALIVKARENGIYQEIGRVEGELDNLLSNDEIYWRQRSRSDWLAAGDKNSRYFHRKASARKRKNWIETLEDEGGRKFTDEKCIFETVCNYFESLFSSSSPSAEDFGLCSEVITSRIGLHMRHELEKWFVAEEVWLTVFNLGPTKALGHDGFHALFFQKIWHVVGTDVSRVCLKVLNEEASIRNFNKTNVVLIPKKKNPMNMKDVRPISLCSVVYKIVTKAMANHLKGFLPKIISPNQSAFVLGRLIFDNVLVGFELFHSIGKRKKGKKCFIALKIDMSKAYDRVEWSFL
ncbi:hypothetical protein Dsin_024327 [Dipteronia sinensis]|uniref:Reverse transcriptase domain-containing protein n=1 Tax=Dipteronia sinensis TaxID=43782 RepID=A0AAD9ZU87_9ROSI|nr:hypothetical protein Dsin_024327 [Dipteronia sinensis]